MQKCSLCGGKVVNGRCEDCGMPIPPENRYVLRGETVHTHEVNGEKVLHRVRQAPDKKAAYSRPSASPARSRQPGRMPAHPYQIGQKGQGAKGRNNWVWWFVVIAVAIGFLSEMVSSLSA